MSPDSLGDRSLKPGDLVGRYRIIEPVAAGGGGEVYRAEDSALHRTVALKLLSPSLASDKEFHGRFYSEARVVASLNHPNIVTLYDFGEHKGRPYAVMEHIEGESVQTMLESGPVEFSQAVEIVRQVGEGLSAAHELGLVHGDIKPGNIMVDRSGRARLLDFGLAGPSQETGGSSVGTVAFMSPEQATGSAMDERSDLYSLGAVLYNMLTGRVPFEGEYEAAVKYAIVNEAHAPVDRFAAIPPRVAAVVDKLLSKEPDNRFQSADDLLREMDAEAGGSKPATLGSLRKILRWPAAVAAVLVLLLLFWNQFQETPETDRKMLAVLPFQNVGDSVDNYFANGMTDEITAQLASMSGLGVISRTSAMKYARTTMSLPEVADELGVQYVLEGSVLWDKSGPIQRIRVIPRLVRARDDSQLWTASYDEEMTELFQVQSRIAEQIAAALNVTLHKSDRTAFGLSPTANLEAYDFYLRGNEYFNQSWDKRDIEIAIDMYKQAVASDSTFARAWAMLCRGHESMYWEYFDHSAERLQLAQEAVDRALKLQPKLMEGHLALGFLYYHRDRDYDRALAEFRLALRANPNSAELYNAVAAVQRRQGKLEESAASFIRAFELNPLSHINAFEVGLTFGMMRRYHLAQLYLAKAQALKPDTPLYYVYMAWLQIFRDGDVAQARQVLASAEGRCDLWQSKYHWWLARIVQTDYHVVLEKMHPGPDTVDYYLQCGRICRLLDDTVSETAYADSAMRLLEADNRLSATDAKTLMYLALANAGHRGFEAARKYAEASVEQLPASRDAFDALFLVVDFAEILMMSGDHEGAVRQLAYLMSIPGFVSASYLKLDPLWKPLRGRPDFDELIRSAGEA